MVSSRKRPESYCHKGLRWDEAKNSLYLVSPHSNIL